jgi:serine/threonine protein phosphatase PrpC
VNRLLTVRAAARTDVGLTRRRNEDAVFAGQQLFAVADGLGGHPAGDVASATVINALHPFDQPVPDPAELSPIAGRAVRAANEALRHRIDAEPALAGMGTTLVALLCSTTTAVLANIGDSRAYLLRRDGSCDDDETPPLIRLTDDHTYGNLVADAAPVPGLRDVLCRFLDGRADGRSPDITTHSLHDGDRFLLCSDGLSGPVPRDLMHTALTTSTRPDEATDQLVKLALDHGGPDNITVIVIDIGMAAAPPPAQRPQGASIRVPRLTC